MKKFENIINYFIDADFWIFVFFLTKINTNSAKICLLFRRKGIKQQSFGTVGPFPNAVCHRLSPGAVLGQLPREKDGSVDAQAI